MDISYLDEFYGSPLSPRSFFRFEMTSTQDYIDFIKKEEYVFKGSSQKKLVIKKDLYDTVYYPVDINGIGNIYKIILNTQKDIGCKLRISYINESEQTITFTTPYFTEFNYLSFIPIKEKITSIEATTDSVEDTIITITVFTA